MAFEEIPAREENTWRLQGEGEVWEGRYIAATGAGEAQKGPCNRYAFYGPSLSVLPL